MNNILPFTQDITAIGRIRIVPYILETICRVTGLGFAAVARVTPEQWVTMAVNDKIQFGLLPGGELPIETTICNEIRQSGQGVVIDCVAKDEFYRSHHVPQLYKFQSYISLPIVRNDGGFFGTLCAIDPHPAILNTPAIINMFKAYSELIAFHLDSPGVDRLHDRTRDVLKRQLISLTGHGFEEDSAGGHITTIIVDRDSAEYNDIISEANSNIMHLLAELKKA